MICVDTGITIQSQQTEVLCWAQLIYEVWTTKDYVAFPWECRQMRFNWIRRYHPRKPWYEAWDICSQWWYSYSDTSVHAAVIWPVCRSTGMHMMTSSNGNIFRVTGPLCGEFTGPGEFPTQRPVTRSFDIFFDLRLNKRLSKQSYGWWFETRSWSLWRHCNVKVNDMVVCKNTC